MQFYRIRQSPEWLKKGMEANPHGDAGSKLRIKQRPFLFSAGCRMYVVLGISFLSDLSLVI